MTPSGRKTSTWPSFVRGIWRLLPILACLSLTAAGDSLVARPGWPQFRGTDSNSVAMCEMLPADLDGEQSILWKADLPGRGPSSPIVVGGQVFVTASSGFDQDRLHVLSFAAEDGRKLWDANSGPPAVRSRTHPVPTRPRPQLATANLCMRSFRRTI